MSYWLLQHLLRETAVWFVLTEAVNDHIFQFMYIAYPPVNIAQTCCGVQ
jgi:hypothetical protein